MEERAGTILTHVRDAEQFRVLRLVTAVRKARLSHARIRAKMDCDARPKYFARERSCRDRRQLRTGS